MVIGKGNGLRPNTTPIRLTLNFRTSDPPTTERRFKLHLYLLRGRDEFLDAGATISDVGIGAH